MGAIAGELGFLTVIESVRCLECGEVYSKPVEGGTATLDLRVGSGTYVRAIAEALGGHCRTLRRTEVGPFSVADAVTPEAFEPGRLLPESEILRRVEALT